MDRVAFSIGSVEIYWYAIFILTGIIIAFYVARFIAKERNINLKDFDDLVFYGLILAIIGTRLYYVIFNWSLYSGDLVKIINVRDGGLAIHGGIITAFVWGFYFCRKRKIDFFNAADAAALGFLIAQSIGRWGNFINQEAHGGQTTKATLESFFIPDFIIEGMYINGVYYHPTFFYESVWNLIGFIIAFSLRNKVFKQKGDIFCFFVVWYSFIRLFIEQMRTDSLMLGDFKVAQIVSILGLILGTSIFFIKRKYIGGSNENSNNSVNQEQ